MAKMFLEIIEDVGEIIKTPKMIKIEVKDLKEAKDKLKVEEPNFVGLVYSKRFHTCRHQEIGEANNQPCEITNL